MNTANDINSLKPLAKIIADEAILNNISVEVINSDLGYFKLMKGERSIICRESLSELTSSISASICSNKFLSSSILSNSGINTTNQFVIKNYADAYAFLKEQKKVVIKPIDGEQGKGVIVGITSVEELKCAYEIASECSDELLIESYVNGTDLRVIVINNSVIAVAARTPPVIRGNGSKTVLELINRYNSSSERDKDSSIPIDIETIRCIENKGHTLNAILGKGINLKVRMNSNVHTGGSIVDVTNMISGEIKKTSIRIAEILKIPVVGIDFIVPEISSSKYVFIEANERPGLINHEPQPTAKAFIDYIFTH